MRTTELDVERICRQADVAGCHFRPRMESTSDWALEHGRDERLATPYLVLTSEQTAGRGRGGKSWWAAPGSLTFTLILGGRPTGLGSQPCALSLAAGVSICRAVDEILAPRSITAAIKWPNDVYVDDRKLSGILIEPIPARPAYWAVGCGANVNNTLHDAPRELADSVTSLCDLAAEPFDLTDVAITVVRSLVAGWTAACRDGGVAAIALARQKNWLLGKTIAAQTPAGPVTGRVDGIADDGGLLVQSSAGITVVYSAAMELL